MLLRLGQVESRVGLKKSKIYALIAEGKFPRPVKIGHASSWVSTEIDQWIAALATERTMSTDCEVSA